MSWTTTSLTEFADLLSSVREKSSGDPSVGEAMYAIAHNIKGMGTSFGFLLMTDLGTTLCTYLRGLPKDSGISVPIIEAHLKAMDVILNNKIDGDGGEMGEKLKTRIDEIIKKNT